MGHSITNRITRTSQTHYVSARAILLAPCLFHQMQLVTSGGRFSVLKLPIGPSVMVRHILL